MELLEAAGVPEFPEDRPTTPYDAWEHYVGSQTEEEFVHYNDGPVTVGSMESYLEEMGLEDPVERSRVAKLLMEQVEEWEHR